MKKLEQLQAQEYVGTLEGLQNCRLADNVKAELQNNLLERAASNNDATVRWWLVLQKLPVEGCQSFCFS